MPGVLTTDLGQVAIDESLIANIAGYAALENYGIASMSSKTAGDAILQLIGGENHRRGVKVSFSEDSTEVDIDLFVTLIYGVSLPAVAQNMMSNVRYKVHELTGLNVRNVNIHVETVRV